MTKDSDQKLEKSGFSTPTKVAIGLIVLGLAEMAISTGLQNLAAQHGMRIDSPTLDAANLIAFGAVALSSLYLVLNAFNHVSISDNDRGVDKKVGDIDDQITNVEDLLEGLTTIRDEFASKRIRPKREKKKDKPPEGDDD